MQKYEVTESDQFLKDVEEAAVWILVTNIEQSETLAEQKIEDFQNDLNSLKNRLSEFPESGQADDIVGLRKFPIYLGRYSVKWIVNHIEKRVTLVTIADSKYPQNLREFKYDD